MEIGAGLPPQGIIKLQVTCLKFEVCTIAEMIDLDAISVLTEVSTFLATVEGRRRIPLGRSITGETAPHIAGIVWEHAFGGAQPTKCDRSTREFFTRFFYTPLSSDFLSEEEFECIVLRPTGGVRMSCELRASSFVVSR